MNSLDWFLLLWSPLWFCWDLCNNALILITTRHWIKGGVTETKDQVIKELCEPKTFLKVRKAMGIPTTDDIRTIIKEELSNIKIEIPMPSQAQLMGKEGAELRLEAKEASEEFLAAQAVQLNVTKVENFLASKGLPRPVAASLAQQGPLAIRGALTEMFGMKPKAAKQLVLQMMMNPDLQGASKPVSSGGIQW